MAKKRKSSAKRAGHGAPKRGDAMPGGGVFVGRRSGVNWIAYKPEHYATMIRAFDAQSEKYPSRGSDPDDGSEGNAKRPKLTESGWARRLAQDEQKAPVVTLENVIASGAVIIGVVGAPTLNSRIEARPLGSRVPPSVGASVLCLVVGAAARHAGLLKTGKAGIGLGVGLAVGTIVTSKTEGGMMAKG